MVPTNHAATASLGTWATARAASTSPALTDVSRPPARVELSGRVLVNWWAKDVGLLENEFSLGPGVLVLFRTPAHWRTLPLALAALSLGATVLDSRDISAADVDLLITHQPNAGDALDAPELLAVTLETLAVDFGSTLPAGAIDHAAEVRGYPDRLDLVEVTAAKARWSLGADTEHSQGTLSEFLALAAAEGASGASAATSSLPASSGVLIATAQLLAAGSGGSLVLHDGSEPAATLSAQERITRQGGVAL